MTFVSTQKISLWISVETGEKLEIKKTSPSPLFFGDQQPKGNFTQREIAGLIKGLLSTMTLQTRPLLGGWQPMILRVLNLDQGEIISHFVCQAKTSPPVAVGNISSFFGLRGNRGEMAAG